MFCEKKIMLSLGLVIRAVSLSDNQHNEQAPRIWEHPSNVRKKASLRYNARN
jgi:hypothetical protein